MAAELDVRLAAHRVAVLGPVAMGPRDELRPLSERPARALLALAAAAGRPCSVELLADVVWGDDRPATYRPALHVHLGTVRRMLDDLGGGPQIVRSDAGYSLELGDCELDATLAVDLLTGARHLIPGQPSVALHLTETALGLWRGVPFAVDGEVVDVSASQLLEAARRDGEELLIEALLQLGDASRAEALAVRAVAAEPLRENRWGQLLRARYLSGRTAEALATYQAARQALVEAVGVEPGRDLQDLEAAALTHDSVRLRLVSRRSAPRCDPPRTTGPFVAREHELRDVEETIARARRVSILGPPGVGKSRVAAEVARRVGTEAVAWIDLRDPTSRQARLWFDLMEWARRHPDGLVVLDNAEVARHEVEDAIREFERLAPSLGIVVTSRVPLAIDIAVAVLPPLELPTPDADDNEIETSPAVQALRAFLRELAPSAALCPREVAELARRAGGLPLMLRLLAASARSLPASTIVDLPPSRDGDEIDRGTRGVLEHLDKTSRMAFADLSVVCGEFDAELGALVTGLDREPFTAALIGLIDHGLVQARPDRARPYALLEPIRSVAGRLLIESSRRDVANDRHVDACIALARSLERLTADTEASGLEERFVAEMPQHRQALAHLAQTNDAERALLLVCRLETPLYVLGWWAEKVDLFDEALAIAGPPTVMRARAHAFRARPGPMHMLDVAHAERAEAIATEIGHETLRAFARFIRSLSLWWSGRPAEAAGLAEEVATVFERSGRRLEALEARKFLGVALVLDGQATVGLEIQHEVLESVRREFATPFHIAHNLAYLGHCHRRLGDDRAALADWTEARELSGRIGNRGTAIHISIGLAEIAADRGEPEIALERTGDALELVNAGRAWTYEPWAWTVAMRAHLAAGDLRSAVACARRATAGLMCAPSGETTRLARELAGVALAAEDLTAAARLIGVAEATDDVRELPFPAPAECERWRATKAIVTERLGDVAREHVDAGRRCTVAEAAGALLIE